MIRLCFSTASGIDLGENEPMEILTTAPKRMADPLRFVGFTIRTTEVDALPLQEVQQIPPYPDRQLHS